MPRTVVHVQENLDGKGHFYLENPKNYPDAKILYPLQIDASMTPFREMHDGIPYADVVWDAGQKIYNELIIHPAIRSALQALFAQNYGQTSTVCFHLDQSRAEDLPWEALVNMAEQAFLALDSRWSIARLREANTDVKVEYVLQPPLRLMAILSAAGSTAATRASATQEWEELFRTVDASLAAHGLPIRLLVLVGEENLKTEIDALHKPWISTEWIVDWDRLLRAIRDFSPHLLHFFCHGTTQLIPRLQIGSRSDWEAGSDGSITVTASDLRQFADPQQVIWLVTLNCCESAAQTKDARSMASSLVAAGFPAAVGMREAVDTAQAHKLCRFLYRAIWDRLNTVVEDAPATEVEWAYTLLDARANLSTQDAQGVPTQVAARNCKYWTIPVLYIRPEPFRLRRLSSAPALSMTDKLRLLQEYQELQQQRSQVAAMPNVPASVLQDVLKEFDDKINEIETRLRA